jgi:superfamily I DNA/RNA helicase
LDADNPRRIGKRINIGGLDVSSTWWIEEGDLLDEQLQVLGQDLFQDLILTGPPGSGKTNILLLRANHLMLASPTSEFYIICFTSLLRNFVRTGASLYSFPENRIITQSKLFEQVLGEHGRLPPRKDNETFSERDTSLKSAISELMKLGIGRHSYPVLFIDEAQDYTGEDLNIFKYLAEHISCAADLRQGIYDDGETGTAWLAGHDWGASIALRYHYRVAPAILEVADKIMNGKFDHIPMIGTHQYRGDPGDIDVISGITLENQVEILIPKLIKQLSVYPNQVIGILIPQRDDVAQIFQKISKVAELSSLVTNAMSREFNPDLPIWVSTVHSSKGLEFRCVHILDADLFPIFRSYERRTAFTAVTRAKTSLSIYHNRPLHPFFASALAKPNAEKINISQLFGKTS